MLRNQLIKKIGWISLLVLPTIYIPSIIAYKTIHYLNSGVDLVAEKIPEEIEPENKININDHLGVIDVGPINNLDIFNIIQRVNLIKQLNFDYKEFEIKKLEGNLVELTVKKDSAKYIQNEIVLVEYEIQENVQLEFISKDTNIKFSLSEKVEIVKFEKSEAYINKESFELVFNKKFLQLGPLNEEIELRFSYDKINKPKNVKAIYVGFDTPFEWTYSIDSK